MKSSRSRLTAGLLLVPLLLLAAPALRAAEANPLAGRWRLDTARSTALDGWTTWDLVIGGDRQQVSLRHDMQWLRTKQSFTYTVETSRPVTLRDFFRVEQRHMALYPAKGGETVARATWLDGGRTLRVEADTPIEISQGQAMMRIYAEYRLLEGGTQLLLIELHSSRPRPLVYRFTRVQEN